MKHLKRLGLVVVATAALMALVGASTASATTLTNGAGEALGIGAELHAYSSGTVTLTTTFKNIECAESTVFGKISDEGGEGHDVSVGIEKQNLIWNGCNCEVKTLAGGSLSISSSGGNSGTVTSRNAQVTTECSTIFGKVHCIYATGAGTTLGTLTGGGGATLAIKGNNIPRLKTSAVCAEKANWDATYVFGSPPTLNID